MSSRLVSEALDRRGPLRKHEALAEALVNTLLEPARALVAFATPESTASFLAQHGQSPHPAPAPAVA